MAEVSAGSKENPSAKDNAPLIVEGYAFYTKKDAELAELEKKKVDALMERINFKSPETVLAVYEKAVADRVFKTPVGVEFLVELRDILYNSPNIANERISPIALSANYAPTDVEVYMLPGDDSDIENF